MANEWRGKISIKIDESCPHYYGPQSVKSVEHRFLVVHSLNNSGGMLLISCGMCLPKEAIIAWGNYFLLCNGIFTNLCARYWYSSTTSVFFEGVVLCGLFGANEMIKCLMRCNVLLRKHDKSFGTPCKIMGGLSGNIPYWMSRNLQEVGAQSK